MGKEAHVNMKTFKREAATSQENWELPEAEAGEGEEVFQVPHWRAWREHGPIVMLTCGLLSSRTERMHF